MPICGYPQAPSPCAEFSVDTYNVTFFEIANSIKDQQLAPAFSVPWNSSDIIVSRTLTSSDGILQGRLYNFTIIASNTAGSSDFTGSLCELCSPAECT